MSECRARAARPETAALRPPDVVMRLARMGAAHQTRLSFLQPHAAPRGSGTAGVFTRPRFDIDARGVGVAIYCVDIRERGPTASSPSAMTCRRSGAPTALSPRPGM